MLCEEKVSLTPPEWLSESKLGMGWGGEGGWVLSSRIDCIGCVEDCISLILPCGLSVPITAQPGLMFLSDSLGSTGESDGDCLCLF